MIPFSPPRIDDKIINEVVKTLNSGWITTGPQTKLFEKKIAEYCQIENVLAVNSWTAGAEMLLKWFGIQKGDEIIIPAYTYCATANIAIHCGAKIILVDVNEDFNIDYEQIEKVISPKTKAIISVDVGGYPVDYKKIKDIINKPEIKKKFRPRNQIQQKLKRILFLSDAAHSFGAMFEKKAVGTIADFTVFSFHAVKNLTTAEGGAIIINLSSPFDNKEIYRELNILSLHGQNKDALAKAQKGAWEYDVLFPGFKCNMTDILATIGLVEIDRYRMETIVKRKLIFQEYERLLKKYDWIILPEYISESKESSYHLFMIRIKNIDKNIRNRIVSRVFEKNVSVNVHYKPLPLLTAYKNLGFTMDKYPVSNQLWESEITLPVYYDLTSEQIDTVVRALVESYEEEIHK